MRKKNLGVERQIYERIGRVCEIHLNMELKSNLNNCTYDENK